MKNQALFSYKDKGKKIKCHLLQFVFGALRVSGSPLSLLMEMIFMVQTVLILIRGVWSGSTLFPKIDFVPFNRQMVKYLLERNDTASIKH